MNLQDLCSLKISGFIKSNLKVNNWNHDPISELCKTQLHTCKHLSLFFNSLLLLLLYFERHIIFL